MHGPFQLDTTRAAAGQLAIHADFEKAHPSAGRRFERFHRLTRVNRRAKKEQTNACQKQGSIVKDGDGFEHFGVPL